MKLSTIHTIILTITVTLGFAIAASAAPIQLFNTGVDGLGNNAAANSIDTHWVLSSAPSGGPNAFVQNPRPGSWVPNQSTPDSQWIGPDPNGNVGFIGGTYVYDMTFDLTGFDPTTANVSGSWASDNVSTVFLNGVNTGNTHVGGATAFQSFDTFTLNSGFQAGVNTLTFQVTNGGGPTGLHVGRLRGDAAVPEPASVLLALLGGVALIGVRRLV